MLHVANAQDFKVALSEVLRHARRPNPSRYALANELEGLAMKLGARAPRKRRNAPQNPYSGRLELVNIAEKEKSSLDYLSSKLRGAIDDLDIERRSILDGISTLEDQAKMEERKLDKEEIETKWVAHSFFVSQITAFFTVGLDYLADVLETHAQITREFELAEAVRAFVKRVPDDGDWLEGKGEKLFKDVQKAIAKAIDNVPTGLSKPSELGKLSACLDAIADAVKLMTGKSVPVPKVPNALDPEDPRQLGFGFAASSRRIGNAIELTQRLNTVWRVASRPNPSRETLSGSLLDVVDGLRARR